MHRAAEPDEDPSQWADPNEVTEIFVYLASDESREVHGQRFQAQDEDELKDTTHEGALFYIPDFPPTWMMILMPSISPQKRSTLSVRQPLKKLITRIKQADG